MEVLGERGPFERQRHLRAERLDAFPRISGQPFARVDEERAQRPAPLPEERNHRLRAVASCEVCTSVRKQRVRALTRSGDDRRPARVVESQTDGRAIGADDLERGVDRDPVDVVAGPRGDECRRGLAEGVLATLRALVACDEPSEPHDDERGQRRGGTDDDEELAIADAEGCDRQHRGRHQRRSRESREASAAEALLGIDDRLGQLNHRRMERSRTPQHGRPDEEEIDRVAGVIPAVQRSDPVQRVADELEDEGGRHHRECGGAEPWSEHHSRCQGHEQDVHHRECERDDRLQRGVGCDPRLHQERPRDDGDADGHDAGVHQTRPVATRCLLADHQEQRPGEDDVRSERQEVRGRRKRDLSPLLELDRVHRVRTDGAESADGDQVPRRACAWPVQRDADERRRDRGYREELVPAVVDRGVVRERHVREGTRGGNEKERAVGTRDAHRVPIGTFLGMFKRFRGRSAAGAAADKPRNGGP